MAPEFVSPPTPTPSFRTSPVWWRMWRPANGYRRTDSGRTPVHEGRVRRREKGLGGVHFVPRPNGDVVPLLWRSQWPTSIASKLVSTSNPMGTITNSELELAATIAQFDVLAQHCDVHSHTVHNLSDNAATVAWQQKGAASTSGPVAFLHRLHALHQRHHRYLSLHDFITGVANILSDQCSRIFHLTDSQLIAHFNSSFPHTMYWQMCPVQNETLSALISALLARKTDLVLLLNDPKQRMRIGSAGKNSVSCTQSTRSCETVTTQSPSSKSLPNGTATDARRPCINPSDLERWKTPSARWARRSPNWGARTFEKTPFAPSTSESPASFGATGKRMPPPFPCKTCPYHYHYIYTPTSIHPTIQR
jgi:hypothetical protein